MSPQFWKDGSGNLLVDENGNPYWCDECPCLPGIRLEDCITGSSICADLSGYLIGDVLKRQEDGRCYEYKDNNCTSSLVPFTVESQVDDCDDPDCPIVYLTCQEFLTNPPSSIMFNASGLGPSLSVGGTNCDECGTRNGSYTVPFSTTFSSTVSYQLNNIGGACNYPNGHPSITVNVFCGSNVISALILISAGRRSTGSAIQAIGDAQPKPIDTDLNADPLTIVWRAAGTNQCDGSSATGELSV